MNFLSELRIFLLSLVDLVVIVFICTVFFFIFGAKEVTLMGASISLPLPSEHSFSANLFKTIVADIAPHDVPLIVTSPFSAFGAQMKVAFMLAVVLIFPYILFRVLTYLKPALHEHEVSFIYKIILPASILFFLGALFAYFFVLSPTFSYLYMYTEAIEVVPMLTVDDFISLVMSLILLTGFAFTLPVVMVLLTSIKIVPATFWKKQWRYAILLFLILSAIITPDGSGVSVMLLAVPLCILYGGGTVVSTLTEKTTKNV